MYRNCTIAFFWTASNGCTGTVISVGLFHYCKAYFECVYSNIDSYFLLIYPSKKILFCPAFPPKAAVASDAPGIEMCSERGAF